MEKGLTHLYYGDGKGKTTAAVGLCIRAAGKKKRVLFAQFMKDGASGEVLVLKKIPEIEVLCGRIPHGFYNEMDDAAKKLFAEEQKKLLEAVIDKIEKEMKEMKEMEEMEAMEDIKGQSGKSGEQNPAEIPTEIPAERGVAMVLVLDEVTYAYGRSLIDRKKLENLINNKPDFLEIVMTGRNPEKFLIDAADYVTEMKCRRHPFEKGIRGRKGIEF